MSGPTNSDRAAWAQQSVAYFGNLTGLNMDNEDDAECAFRDLLANMRHMAAELGYDFDDMAEGSREVFDAEVQEEAEDESGEEESE